jgi:hypothetical protein
MNIHNALIIHLNAYSPALKKNTKNYFWFGLQSAVPSVLSGENLRFQAMIILNFTSD